MSKNSQVYVIKTSPKSILKDYQRLMHLAKYQNFFETSSKIILKLNLSWSKFFPACSSPPGSWRVFLKQ